MLCFLQPPTAADDDDFLDFSHDDIFVHQHFRSLTYNDDDSALHDISADVTMTSPLLCDAVYLSFSWVEYRVTLSAKFSLCMPTTNAATVNNAHQRLIHRAPISASFSVSDVRCVCSYKYPVRRWSDEDKNWQREWMKYVDSPVTWHDESQSPSRFIMSLLWSIRATRYKIGLDNFGDVSSPLSQPTTEDQDGSQTRTFATPD